MTRSLMTIKYLQYGENVVNIGPVHPETICLKRSTKKKKKLTQAEHSPRGRQAVLAK